MNKTELKTAYTLSEIYKNRFGRTCVDMTTYSGNTYTLRVIKDKDGVNLIIAGDELFNDIHPGEWEDETEGFDPTNVRDAHKVYDAVFFFTDDTTLRYSDEDLRADMAGENPEWF